MSDLTHPNQIVNLTENRQLLGFKIFIRACPKIHILGQTLILNPNLVYDLIDTERGDIGVITKVIHDEKI